MYKDDELKARDYVRQEFMSDEELLELNKLRAILINNSASMAMTYSRWEDEEEAYKGDQPITSNRPNSRVNIVNAYIDGQVSALVDHNIAIVTRGESPADKYYADWARVGLDWTLRKNKIKKIIDIHERRRLKFGVGFFKTYFDKNAISGFGLAKICCPALDMIYVDRKIIDPLRFQEADYIAEGIKLSREQFIDIYGEEKTRAVYFGTNNSIRHMIFSKTFTHDDLDAAYIIQYWSRHKGMLRLREFTECGLLLYDSHKSGDRKTNQKDSEYKHKSYYKYVCNKYPYFFTGQYPDEDSLWGFGDAKLLIPIQNMINDFYDKIRITARPNLILFDPDSEVDLSDFDENSLEPRPARLSTTKAVEVVPWGQVNNSYWQMLQMMHQEAQRVTRYSELMMGQTRSADTATEASIQQQQGNAVTQHKKTMLEETLIDVCEYCLGLMMEFYEGAKAFRIYGTEDEYEWIDFRKLTKVPVMKPATSGFTKRYMDRKPLDEPPEWEFVMHGQDPATKTVDLDIEISIGSGLPKNKAFLWQMIERLAGLVLVDESGQQKNIINYKEFRQFVKDYLGLPLSDEQPAQQQPGIMQQTQGGGPGGGAMQSAGAMGVPQAGVMAGQAGQQESPIIAAMREAGKMTGSGGNT